MLIFIIAILITLLYGILCSNLKIRFSLARYNGNSGVVISLTGLYGIFKHTKKISTINLTERDKDISAPNINTRISSKRGKSINRNSVIHNTYDIEKMIDSYKKIYIKYEPYIKKIKEKSILNNISWHTKVGTNDAAETAIITGVVWAIKAFVILFITESYNFSNILINVVPNYNINTFETTIDCIFNIKLGYIINANIRVLLAQIKDGVKK